MLAMFQEIMDCIVWRRRERGRVIKGEEKEVKGRKVSNSERGVEEREREISLDLLIKQKVIKLGPEVTHDDVNSSVVQMDHVIDKKVLVW